MGRLQILFDKIVAKIKNHNKKRDYKIWVFGEWFGERCCDNSFYLANHIAEFHPEIKVYWVTKKGVDTSALYSGISILEMDSSESFEVFKKAGVAIMNQGFCDFSSKAYNLFSGGITINLWHGFPWKKIHYDSRKYTGIIAYFYHKILAFSENAMLFLVSSSAMMKLYKTAFLVKDNNVIKAGYPRNQILYDGKSKIESHRKFEKMCQPLTPKTIIAYLPTFRDNKKDVFSFSSVIENQKLINLLENNNAVIIEKGHYACKNNKGKKLNSSGRILFLNEVNTAELLAAADILITDYSSCFCDYTIKNKPIIHFIYDYDYYANCDRGLYYDQKEICCGKTPKTTDELFMTIENYLKDDNLDADIRNVRKQMFWEYDSGDSCERIFKEINSRLH